VPVWNALPESAVTAQSLDEFKGELDRNIRGKLFDFTN